MKLHLNQKTLDSETSWKEGFMPKMTCLVPVDNPIQDSDFPVSHRALQISQQNKMRINTRQPHGSFGNPRIFFVCRRSIRKNKFINYICENHLDFIQRFGGVPIIIPRTNLTLEMLQMYLPMDGLIIAEGEDLDMKYNPYGNNFEINSPLLNYIQEKHPGDAFSDHNKDSIEWTLLDFCLEHNVPFLGLCRGSQILNVKCGGSLYQDIAHEVQNASTHINYENYDNHRHPLTAVIGSPMSKWFSEEINSSQEETFQLMVNSYHHQGIKELSPRFTPMAYSSDGVVEAYYDPQLYDPDRGKFCCAFQFHPERMPNDYPGCIRIYQEFIHSCWIYRSNMFSDD